MTNNEDKAQLQQKGISEERLQQMLLNFQTGFPFLAIDSAATLGHGILSPLKRSRRLTLPLGTAILLTKSTVS